MIAATWSFAVLRSALHPGREGAAPYAGNRKVEVTSEDPVPLSPNKCEIRTDDLPAGPVVLFNAGLFSLFLFLMLFLSTPAVPQTIGGRAAASQSDGGQIHFGDIIDVDVVGSFEFDWRGGLTPEGFLDGLDKLENPVFALCRTENEVAAVIRDQLKILREPNVVVRIVDRSNRALAYVDGAVRVPHRFQMRRPASLAELIVLSGGITDSSSGEITIFRSPHVNCRAYRSPTPAGSDPDKMPTMTTVKIADLLAGHPDANIQITSGDIVNVVEAPPVFLMGDLAAPRRMNLTPNLTLSRAIAAAGGISKAFKGQKARIYRRKPAPSRLEFDIRSVLDKKVEDPKLEPYDVVEVEQKGFGAKKVAPLPEPRAAGREGLSKLPLRIVD